MLQSIILWLIGIFSNETVKLIIQRILIDLTQDARDLLPVAMEVVKEIMTQDLTGEQKFNMAMDRLKKEFPEVSNSVINTVIENVYRVLKVG